MTITYDYTAYDNAKRKVSGTIGAETVTDALKALKESGLATTRIRERTDGYDVRRVFSRPPNSRLTIFRSLASLFQAGSTSTTAFDILIQQAKGGERQAKLPWTKAGAASFTRSLVSLRREVVDSGVPLHEAMQRRPEEFTDIESAMVQVGQQTGELPRIFNLISTFLERERAISKQISSALFYPGLVALASIALMIYILVKVIPQFAGLYAGFDVPIPPMMVAMLALSHLILNPLFDLVIVGAVVGGVYLFLRAIATESGALQFDKIRLSIPVLGGFMTKIVLVRMCRTMSMLFDSGKTQTAVLTIAGPVMGSPSLRLEIQKIRNLLYDGEVSTIYEAFERSNKFDPMFLGYLRVAQETGEYGMLLAKLGDYYEEDVQSLASQIPNILQVLITLGLGGVVGLVVSAVYIPLTTLTTSVH